jgi:hypothetical protein
MNKKKKLSLKKKIIFMGIIAFFPLLLLLVFEIFLRVIIPQPPRGFSGNLFASENGLNGLKPGVEGTQYSREFNVKISGNKFGYRKGSWSKNFAPDSSSPKCVILGDSFAFGWAVESDKIFTNYLGNEYEYADLGIPGDGPIQQLRRLKWALDNIKNIKMIILLVYDNDISEFNSEALKLKQAALEKLPVTAQIKTMLLNFHTIRLISRAIDKLGISKIFANISGYRQMKKNIVVKDIIIHKKDFFKTDKWKECKKVYEKIIAISREKNISLMVVRIVPAYFLDKSIQDKNMQSCGLDSKEYDFSQIDKELGRLFKNYSSFAPESSDMYFKYDMHLNEEGQKALGDFIDKKLNGQKKI